MSSKVLFSLTQAILEDFPLGLLLLSHKGRPLWFNGEAAVACAVWNQGPTGADALPLRRTAFILPPPLWTACQSLLAGWNESANSSQTEIVSDHDHGLLAKIRLQKAKPHPVFFVRMDYRRPRSDREKAISPEALTLLDRLSPREREVALRVRDGLTTAEIAAALCRSPLTIKTQLGGIFRKLGVDNRSRVAALLNR